MVQFDNCTKADSKILVAEYGNITTRKRLFNCVCRLRHQIVIGGWFNRQHKN
ncbi:MAG: hypothetical protein LBJ00_03830 [Planctomycetaceae bacterium]|nr:hypothetical protein [Planctomycetaceae bacterium]